MHALEVVAELKTCFESSVMPDEGGDRPLRACETRFVSHKVAGIKCHAGRRGGIGHYVLVRHVLSHTR